MLKAAIKENCMKVAEKKQYEKTIGLQCYHRNVDLTHKGLKLPPSKRHQHSHVHLAFLKIAKVGNQPKHCLLDEWMKYVVQIFDGILFSLQKAALCCNMHKPG